MTRIFLFLFLIGFPFLSFSQRDKWTEEDWINYRKWECDLFDISRVPLQNIFPDSSQNWILFGPLQSELQDTLIVNGHLFRVVDLVNGMPDSLGFITFYFSDGQLQSKYRINWNPGKLSFFSVFLMEDFFPDGKHKTQIIKNTKYRCDSTIQYYENGRKKNVFINQYEQETDSLKAKFHFSFWENGNLAFKFSGEGRIMAKREEIVYDVNAKTYKPSFMNNQLIEDWQNKKILYFDTLGKEMNEKDFFAYRNRMNTTPAFKTSRKQEYLSLLFDASSLMHHFSMVQDTIFNSHHEIRNLKHKQIFVDLLGKRYYPSGEVFMSSNSVQGKLNGFVKFYYRGGQLMKSFPFVNDSLHGEVLEYFENGNIKGKWKFNKNMVVDSSFSWWPNGNYYHKEFHVSNLEFSSLYYYPNGAIKYSESRMKDYENRISQFSDDLQRSIVIKRIQRFYDISGFEITEEKFRELNPDWEK